MKKTTHITLIACLAAGAAHAENWIPLFNGKDLDGWTPKFADMPAGENHNKIFRVEDGMLLIGISFLRTYGGEGCIAAAR